MSDYIQIARVKGNIDFDYIQLAIIKGHTSNNQKMLKDDFYTLCMKDSKENIGLRKKAKKKCHHLPVFKTSDTNIEYLCSDFVRFCLSIYKDKATIDCKEMSLIPKSPIPISKELKDYIESYLPDYYGIRK